MTGRRLCLGVLVGLLLAAPAWAKPPVWVAHGKHADVVLFGSVHLLPGDIDWEPDALAQALTRADELWFETPLDEAGQLSISRSSLARGFLPPGQRLSDLLPPGGQDRLKAAAEAVGLSLERLEPLQPWFADLTLSGAAYQMQGARADQGVERRLTAAAPQAQRRAFETAEQQISMFADDPPADQIASLQDTAREILEDPHAYQRLVDAWLKGDVAAIDREGVEPMRAVSPALFKVLVSDRNAAWTRVLMQRLKGKGHAVVVVGVGHLIGSQGVPARLRALGVRVDGPLP